MTLKPPMDEVTPLECFRCVRTFKPGDHIIIKNLQRDTDGYNWRWLSNREFDKIIFDGTLTYAIHYDCVSSNDI